MKISTAILRLRSVTLSFLSFFALPSATALAMFLPFSGSTGWPVARAAQAIVQTPVTTRQIGLASPRALTEVMAKNQLGLDLEPDSVREKALEDADTYIALRKGLLSEAKAKAWHKACAESMSRPEVQRTDVDPYCALEVDRARAFEKKIAPFFLADSAPDRATRIREKRERMNRRHRLMALLKNEKYSDLADKPEGEVIAALGSIGDAEKTRPLAERAAAHEPCVPTSVTSAMGLKMEELFPDPKAVELSKALYRRSVACGAGNDAAAAKSAFRLGLILIWQKKFDEIPTLMSKVESTPDAAPIHSRAKYWRYYAAKALGDEKTAKAIQDSLTQEHPLSFASLVANGENDSEWKRMSSGEEPQVALRSLIRPDMNPTLRAAEALITQQANALAMEMLDHNLTGIGSMEPEVRLYTAGLLDRIGSSLPKFKILAGIFQDAPRLLTSTTLKIYFPLWFLDTIKAKQASVDPLLILSLIRQESAFNSAAISSVGARGLMQVMPATARSIASVGGARKSKHRLALDLMDPTTNIGLGSKYFLKRLEQYRGDVELTLAAYNAGFAKVDSWVKRYPTDNKLLFLDFIPFRETREYVSSILRNYYFYTRLYESELAAAAAVASTSTNPNAASAPAASLTSVNAAPVTTTVSPGNGPAKVRAILSANAGTVAYTPKSGHDNP